MPTIWIAVLNISPRVAEKIWNRHELEPNDVRLAVVARTGLPFRWDDHPERGRRAVVETVIARKKVACVLYPVEHPLGGVWNLGGVYGGD